MKACFEIPDKLSDENKENLKNRIKEEIESFTKYRIVEQKYQIPVWVEEKDNNEDALLSVNEIKELLNLGLHIRVVHGADDCHGYYLRIELIDPESGIEIDSIDYYPGWGGGDNIKDILAVFKKFKCDKIIIKEFW